MHINKKCTNFSEVLDVSKEISMKESSQHAIDTEIVPGNVILTTEKVKTIEASPIRMRKSSNSVITTIKANTKKAVEEQKLVNNRTAKTLNSSKVLNLRKLSTQNEALINLMKGDEEDKDEETPRMDLGNIKKIKIRSEEKIEPTRERIEKRLQTSRYFTRTNSAGQSSNVNQPKNQLRSKSFGVKMKAKSSNLKCALSSRLKELDNKEELQAIKSNMHRSADESKEHSETSKNSSEEDKEVSLVQKCTENTRMQKEDIEEKEMTTESKILHSARTYSNNKSKLITYDVDPNSSEAIEFRNYKPTEKEMKLRFSLLAYEKDRDKTKKDVKDPENTEIEGEEKENGKEQAVKKETKIEGDLQSITTSSVVGSTMRFYYSLRTAIDEQFVPRSIRNMRCVAVLVFLLLLSITIVYFAIQSTHYNKIRNSLEVINSSDNRINVLIDATLKITDMMIYSASFNQYQEKLVLDPTNTSINSMIEEIQTVFKKSQSKLESVTTILKNEQTALSLESLKSFKNSLRKINPNMVQVYFMHEPNSPALYNYTLWQAIAEIVVSSYKISTIDISNVNDKTEANVYFVMTNSLNNVLMHLKMSSEAVLAEIESLLKFNVTIFGILLGIASVSLLLFIIIFIPMLNAMNRNKQEIFELFMYIRKHRATQEVDRCRKYLEGIQATQEFELNLYENTHQEEEDQGVSAAAGDPVSSGEKELGPSKRRFKKLTLSFGLLIFKFLFLVTIMEGYFLLNYFLSASFLSQVRSLTEEVDLLISRTSMNNLFLVCVKLAIFKDYIVTFENIKAEDFIQQLTTNLYYGEDQLLNIFSRNYNYHSKSYIDEFNCITFSNICECISQLNNADCNDINGGIFNKGLYSSMIKYWDNLREFNNDYFHSTRTADERDFYLNKENLKTISKMQDIYLAEALSVLVRSISEDMTFLYFLYYAYSFENELIQNIILIVIFLCYLLFIGSLFLTCFIVSSTKSLWKTKSVLSILSLEIIISTEKIKEFILSNSSIALFSKVNNE